jgi:FkbM family methyltransferase
MYYAEFGTDQYIREKFFPDFSEKKVMVEVGAGPVDFLSMSKHFRDFGWRCVCIDPNPKFVESHKKSGNEIYQFACANEEKESTFKIIETQWAQNVNGISYSAIDVKYPLKGPHKKTEIKVKITKLNSLLEKISISKVDLVSIDTEGWELEVMKGFDTEKYQPKVILLENYLHLPEYEKYMNSINYRLEHKIKYNYIFLRK